MRMPIFSVLLPAHRYDDYLQLAIESVLKQTLTNFELIIILNGIDLKYIKNISERFSDGRIKCVHTDLPNLVFALNLGISHAQAKYIVRMDSDDICKESRLEILMETINKNPEVDVIGSAFNLIDANGNHIGRCTLKEMTSENIKKRLPFRCIIPHPTVAMKRESLINVGGYSYGQFSEDYDLWLRMLRSDRFNFMIINESLIDYRVHNSQATSSNNDWYIMSYDLSIKLRELLITKNLRYIPGILYSILDFFYKKIHRLTRRIKQVH